MAVVHLPLWRGHGWTSLAQESVSKPEAMLQGAKACYSSHKWNSLNWPWSYRAAWAPRPQLAKDQGISTLQLFSSWTRYPFNIPRTEPSASAIIPPKVYLKMLIHLEANGDLQAKELLRNRCKMQAPAGNPAWATYAIASHNSSCHDSGHVYQPSQYQLLPWHRYFCKTC